MANFKVLGARVLVKEIKKSDKLNSGIVIPGREKEQTNKGIVLVVGDGAMLDNGTKIPVRVKEGDTVVYAAFAGSPIYDEEKQETYLMLNERDILCYLEKEAGDK